MVQEPTPSEQRSVGSRPHLYDATTLRTLATVERLDLLELAHGECPEPRWTEEVREEVLQAAEDGDLASDRVLRCAWLGDPVCPEVRQLAEIYRLQVALGDGREPPSATRARHRQSSSPRVWVVWWSRMTTPPTCSQRPGSNSESAVWLTLSMC